MSIRKILTLGLTCLAISGAAAAQNSTYVFVDQKSPAFPKSELSKWREGWVVIGYSVSDTGAIVDPAVIDSSGSIAFNEAALSAVRRWRVEPGAEPRNSSVLINFVFDRRQPTMRRSFKRKYAKIGNLIERGELDKAEQTIEKLLDTDLYPTEVSYAWITRARLAEVRGDKADQLDCFRKAMINNGAWLSRSSYLNLLKVTTVLAIQTKDYASAVRDYDLLTKTGPGKKLGAGLADAVEQARALIKNESPYMAANIQYDVSHETPRRRSGVNQSSYPMSGGDDRGSVPPAREPASPGNTNNSG